MKLGLFIFFLSLCFVGSFVNGKKIVQENEIIQLEDCEPSDTNESEGSTSLFSILLSRAPVAGFPYESKQSYHYAFLPIQQIATDSFFPPPDFSASVLY